MKAHPRSITIAYRDLVVFTAGIAIALIVAAVFVGVRTAAAPGADESTFVPIDPCRLFDTRPAFNIGPRDTPIGPDEVHRQQVTGTNGDCTIPTTATAVALNVTVVGATAPSNMRVFPYAPTPPNTSNLNYGPGQPPTPNKVDVKLSDAGELGFYNFAGYVDALADVTGYYTNTGLQDLQAQIGRNTALAAYVKYDGTRLGSGPWTSTRSSTGVYQVTWDNISSYRMPRHFGVYWLNPIPVASTDCDGYPASTRFHGSTYDPDDGYFTKIIIDVVTTNAAGVNADCDFTLQVHLDQPNLNIIAPL